jgi:translation initiation factor 5B
MAPKKVIPKALSQQLKARVQAQRELEDKLKKQEEEEAKRILEEERLAKEQKRIEEEERLKNLELQKQKKKENKITDAQKHNIAIIERMRQAGMILPQEHGIQSNCTIVESKMSNNNNDSNGSNKSNNSSLQETIVTETTEDRGLRSTIVGLVGSCGVGKTCFVEYLIEKKYKGNSTQGFNVIDIPQHKLQKYEKFNNGMVLIDFGGHELFEGIRSRLVSHCDLVVLIIDMNKGVDPCTKKNIDLLTKFNCPFAIAINKIDKVYDWKSNNDASIKSTLELQKQYVKVDFDSQINHLITQLQTHKLNVELVLNGTHEENNIPVFPISCVTGEGISDLMIYLAQEEIIVDDKLEYTVLDIKSTSTVGTVLDVLLINGTLSVGDSIDGVTKIKKILPGNLKQIKGTACVHVLGDSLEDEISKFKVVKNTTGILVHSNSSSILETMLLKLTGQEVPINNFSLGTITKKEIMALQKTVEMDPCYAVIIAHQVTIDEDARIMAKKYNIEIFESEIVSVLLRRMEQHISDYNKKRKEENKEIAIFPVKLQVLDIFRNTKPLIIGCKILNGNLHPGTPLCFFDTDRGTLREIGKVISLQKDKKDLNLGKTGDSIAIGIQCNNSINALEKNMTLSSKISRQSIDALKESFRDEMTDNDWRLLIELKKEQCVV